MKQLAILSRISRLYKLHLFRKHFPTPVEVLEVGSAEGWFGNQLKTLGHHVVTLDLIGPADIVGDIRSWETLKLAPQSFDVIVAFEVIEHVDCLADLIVLTKSGGHLLLSSPNPRFDWLMKILESLGLNQRRTSPHENLTDFAAIPLPSVFLRRPLGIHQLGLYRVVSP